MASSVYLPQLSGYSFCRYEGRDTSFHHTCSTSVSRQVTPPPALPGGQFQRGQNQLPSSEGLETPLYLRPKDPARAGDISSRHMPEARRHQNMFAHRPPSKYVCPLLVSYPVWGWRLPKGRRANERNGAPSHSGRVLFGASLSTHPPPPRTLSIHFLLNQTAMPPRSCEL